MKKLAIALGTVFTALAPAAFGQYDQEPYYGRDDGRYARESFRDRARVIETRPIDVARGERREECWNPRAGHYEAVRGENRTRIGRGAAIGALAGGVLGHQIDSGGGTAAGAVLGGIIGHQVERRRDNDDPQNDLDYSRCRVAGGYGDRVGYEVRYEYDGREYVTQLSHDPGRWLRVGRDINADGTPFVAEYSADHPAYSGG